jgi:hypothetical protein
MPDLTPRIGIKKPLGNENVSRASFNENWDIIDAKVATLGVDGKVPADQLTGQNAFANVNANGALLTADNKADQFNVFSGTGISVSSNSATNSMTISVDQSPWTDLALQNGVAEYSVGSAPKYCKVGNQVFIVGAIKNVTSFPVTVGTLPAGFRPVGTSHAFSQTSSNDGNTATSARWQISTSGVITLDGKSGTAVNTATWFPMHTNFIVG